MVQLEKDETLGQVMTKADGLMYDSKIRKKWDVGNGRKVGPLFDLP